MDRTFNNRRRGPDFGPKLALLATAAIASATLSGCATASTPRADVSFNKAQVALEKGQTSKAIEHGEAAVLADPRNASFRALLGAAYLEAGRFQSAATSFGDAIQLGDTDGRTILSYALAKTAIGEGKQALTELRDWESALDPADAGLALALAGNPERGVHVLTNALRAGQNSAKVRQNLAYTYALAGNWRAARVMAAEDVPADQLDARLSDWAATAAPEDHMVRVANLLKITPSSDGGLPGSLALSNFPSQQQMVAEAKASMPMDKEPAQVAKAPGKVSETEALTFARGSESEPVEKVDPTVSKILAATNVAAYAEKPKAEAASKPVVKPVPKATPTPRVSSKVAKAAPAPAPRFVSKPMVQSVPAQKVAQRQAPKRVTPAPAAASRSYSAPKADSHLIQLGSFSTRAVAEEKWKDFQRKFPQLKAHDVVITKAEVKGKIYYRVAAAGFGRSTAAKMCSTVKSSGRGCFAYAKTNPPKGAVETGVRIAAR